MGHLCLECEKPESKGKGRVEFIHEGLAVSIRRPGGTCLHCCRQDFLLRFRIYSNCIKYAEGKITEIDWKLFQLVNDMDNISEFFLNLGIFSIDPVNCWQIMSEGVADLNPRYSSIVMYFTNFTDAVSYAKERFLHTQYNWNLQKISEVCSRKDLSELGFLDRNDVNLTFIR